MLQDVPASLLLRRPDIRAAELQVAAQSALIGVAKADLYPSLTLLGSIGWSASSLPGTPTGLVLIGGPSLRWNVFDYGRIRNTYAYRMRACSSSSCPTRTAYGRPRARRTTPPAA